MIEPDRAKCIESLDGHLELVGQVLCKLVNLRRTACEQHSVNRRRVNRGRPEEVERSLNLERQHFGNALKRGLDLLCGKLLVECRSAFDRFGLLEGEVQLFL